MINRRTHSRTVVNERIPIKLKVKDMTLMGYLIDVSNGGVRVRLLENDNRLYLYQYDNISFTVSLPSGGTKSVSSAIRWIKAYVDGDMVGLKFMEKGEEMVKLLFWESRLIKEE